MKFTLFIENFRCISRFEKTFNNGINVVSGDSGSGKSTLYQAVRWLIFGEVITVTPVYASKKTVTTVRITIHEDEGDVVMVRKNNPRRLTVTSQDVCYQTEAAQSIIFKYFNPNGTFFIQQKKLHSLVESGDSMKKDTLIRSFFNGAESYSLVTKVTGKISELKSLHRDLESKSDQCSKLLHKYSDKYDIDTSDLRNVKSDLKMLMSKVEYLKTERTLSIVALREQEKCLKSIAKCERLLENVLGDNTLEELRDIAKREVDVSNIPRLEGIVTSLEEYLKSLEAEKEYLTLELTRYGQSLDDVKTRIKMITDQGTKEISTLKTSCPTKLELKKIKDKSDSLSSKIDSIFRKERDLTIKATTIETKITEYEDAKDIDHTKLTELSRQQASYDTKIKNIKQCCNNCGVDDNPEALAEYIKKLNSSIIEDFEAFEDEYRRVLEVQDKNKELSCTSANLVKRLKAVEKKYKNTTQSLDRCNELLPKYKDSCEKASTSIDAIMASIVSKYGKLVVCPCCDTDVAYYEGKLHSLAADVRTDVNKKELESLRHMLQKHTDNVRDTVSKIELYTEQQSEYGEEIADIKKKLDQVYSEMDSSVNASVIKSMNEKIANHTKASFKSQELSRIVWPEVVDNEEKIEMCERKIKFDKYISLMNRTMKDLTETRELLKKQKLKYEENLTTLSETKDKMSKISKEIVAKEQYIDEILFKENKYYKEYSDNISLLTKNLKTILQNISSVQLVVKFTKASVETTERKSLRVRELAADAEKKLTKIKGINSSIEKIKSLPIFDKEVVHPDKIKRKIHHIKIKINKLNKLSACRDVYKEKLELDVNIKETGLGIERYLRLLDGINTFNLEIVTRMLGRINAILNAMVANVFSKKVYVSLSSTYKSKNGNERFAITPIVKMDGEVMSFSSISEGEKARISFCVCIAVNAINGTSMLILDEPVAGTGKEDIIKCLNCISRDPQINPVHDIIGSYLENATILISEHGLPMSPEYKVVSV